MKRSTFIAIAAVISGSFLISNPSEARNGWEKVSCDSNNDCSYQKVIKRTGSITTVKTKTPNGDFTEERDCNKWNYRYIMADGTKTQWEEVMPESLGETFMRMSCS